MKSGLPGGRENVAVQMHQVLVTRAVQISEIQSNFAYSATQTTVPQIPQWGMPVDFVARITASLSSSFKNDSFSITSNCQYHYILAIQKGSRVLQDCSMHKCAN